ncbi:MAG: lipopolysaccharide kinase InaA family protein [Gammaproteobacteria bacterium]|nr:lipopolysaccharide kinase InaA family protein [Gammaproteobacteria bacterium]
MLDGSLRRLHAGRQPPGRAGHRRPRRSRSPRHPHGDAGTALPDGLLAEVAKCLGVMHRRRLAHGNLYPKHVFVHRELAAGGAPDDPVRIIDLEDAHRVPLARFALVRDLEKLDRYSEGAERLSPPAVLPQVSRRSARLDAPAAPARGHRPAAADGRCGDGGPSVRIRRSSASIDGSRHVQAPHHRGQRGGRASLAFRHRP